MYEERNYRRLMRPENLTSFTIIEEESDLHISADQDLRDRARAALSNCRNQLKTYIEYQPAFLSSLIPIEIATSAPWIIQRMAKASTIAGVGPMAAVAGAVAEAVGNDLLFQSEEVLVENGGDLFIKINRPKKILLHCGSSPFSDKLALLIEPANDPIGICTSSGKIGHSLSFGKADAVVAISKNTCLADAAATAICNRVSRPEEIESALAWGKDLPGIMGLIIVIGDKLGTWGDITLTRPY